MKPTVYIETTVPSYFVARPSRDVVVLAHQEMTKIWWERRLGDFHPYVSPVVLEEAARGDESLAQRRLASIAEFEILETTSKVEALAACYMREINLPSSAIRDAAHLAFACAYDLDYLLTWNCTPIANAEIVRTVTAYNLRTGWPIPTICTPEELLGMEAP